MPDMSDVHKCSIEFTFAGPSMYSYVVTLTEDSMKHKTMVAKLTLKYLRFIDTIWSCQEF